MAANRSFAVRPAGPDDLVVVLRVLAEGGSDQGAPDEGALDGATALEVRTMPTSVLYDAQGREVWRYVGDLDWTGEEARTLVAEAR